ncbi:TIGR00341 family protein [Patescibacteria group bacterium]
MIEIKSNQMYQRLLFSEVAKLSKFTGQYLVQLILSTVITTLGLLDNNTIVVLGAMLLSPLFWPITGIALGIITTRRNLLKNSVISAVVSTIIVFIVSSVITVLLPVNTISAAIQLRVSPDLIDLFIALAVSIIGVLALYFPSISSSATGVAISISLVPPLCVSGIGLAFLNGRYIWKSLLLYGTNVGAIIFAGVVIFYLLGVRPKALEEEKRFRMGVLLSSLIMFLLSIPLSFYLKETISQNQISSSLSKILKDEMALLNREVKVEDINMEFGSDKLDIEALIYLPEEVFITRKYKDMLLNKLSEESGSEVNLDMSIINTVSLKSEEDVQKTALRQSIRDATYLKVKDIVNNVRIEDVKVTLGEEVQVLLTVRAPSDFNLEYSDIKLIERSLEEEFNTEIVIETEVIQVDKILGTSEENKSD